MAAEEPGTHAGPVLTSVVALGLLAVAALLLELITGLWPQYAGAGGLAAGANRALLPARVDLLLWNLVVDGDFDLRLLLLVAVAGAIGSYIHAATSFVTYVGNRTFVRSWLWWYALRLPIGSATAVLLYFVVRGGFLSPAADPEDVDLFGMIAIAGLAGMFSKQASDKLREVFDDLFRVSKGSGDDERKDKLDDSAPVIESTVPAMLTIGTAGDVKIIGQRIAQDAKVFIGGTERSTRVISDSELEFTLDAADVASAGDLEVTVVREGHRRSSVFKITVA